MSNIPIQLKILQWYKNPSLFFKELYGEDPYSYQKDVLDLMKDLRRILILASGGTGKTKLLAAIGLYFAIVYAQFHNKKYDVVIISGSMEQSGTLYDYFAIPLKNHPILSTLVDGDVLKTEVRFKNGSVIRALPLSLKSIQGKHMPLVIIDEAALVDDFTIGDTYRIVGGFEDSKILLSGTPMSYDSLFVKMWGDEKQYPDFKDSKNPDDWKRFYWSCLQCPRFTPKEIEEAKRTLTEEQFQVFWIGRPYPLTNTVVPIDKIRKASIGIKKFDYDPNKKNGIILFGIDYGFCLSEDTEILSDRGWKTYKNIKNGDFVLTLNPVTLESEYQKCISISFRDYEGEMMNLKSKNIDLLLTYNHPIPFMHRPKAKNRFLHFHKIGERVTHDYLIRKAKFIGNKPDYFLLPEYKNSYISGNGAKNIIIRKEREIKIEDFLEFFGWFITEGHCRKSLKRVEISQAGKKHFQYRKEINDLLKRMGLSFSLYKNKDFLIYDVQLWSYLKQFGKSETKFIPNEIKNLDYTLLNILVKTMMKGDGSNSGFQYETKSEQLSNDFQEILLKSGEYIPWINRHKNLYSINIKSKNSSPNRNHYISTDYNGKIWYLSVPNEIILVRRKSKPCFIHNADLTVIVVVELIDGNYKVLNVIEWNRQMYDTIQDWIEAYALQYKPDYVFVDLNPKGESQRTVERLLSKGIRTEAVDLGQNLGSLQVRMQNIFEKERILIPEEFMNLTNELKSYTWNKRKGDDRTTALMLALKDIETRGNTDFYYKVARPRGRSIV